MSHNLNRLSRVLVRALLVAFLALPVLPARADPPPADADDDGIPDTVEAAAASIPGDADPKGTVDTVSVEGQFTFVEADVDVGTDGEMTVNTHMKITSDDAIFEGFAGYLKVSGSYRNDGLYEVKSVSTDKKELELNVLPALSRWLEEEPRRLSEEGEEPERWESPLRVTLTQYEKWGKSDKDKKDTDGDGIDDGDEDTNHDGKWDAGETCAWLADSDGDGLDDDEEDTNKDGKIAGDDNENGVWERDAELLTEEGATLETWTETDPLDHDTDDDGLTDGFEGRTNALKPDRDNDGILDGVEDRDRDGNVDVAEDLDRDGKLDSAEDLDGDGHRDVDEDLDGDGNFDSVYEDLNNNQTLDDGEDLDGDGQLDVGEDRNHNGQLDTHEDLNNNNTLDDGEDLDEDEHLDKVKEVDSNGDGNLDVDEDLNNNGEFDPEPVVPADDHGWGGKAPKQVDGEDVKYQEIDRDGDGVLDTVNEDLDGDGHWDVGEDRDRDGVWDKTEDLDQDGRFDRGEPDTTFNGQFDRDEDFDDDGNLDVDEDLNNNGVFDTEEVTPADTNGWGGTVETSKKYMEYDVDGDNRLDLFNEDLDGDDYLDAVPEADQDGDGRPDAAEMDPNDEDTDNDGALDGEEDANGDGLILGDENENRIIDPGETWLESDPLNPDTDGDGVKDGHEGAAYDASVPQDERTNSGRRWNVDLDDDNLINPLDNDSDGDGLPEAGSFPEESYGGTTAKELFEGQDKYTEPYNRDTDGDTMPDGWELQYRQIAIENGQSPDALDPCRRLSLLPENQRDTDGGSRDNDEEYEEGKDPTDEADDRLEPAGTEAAAFAVKIGGDTSGTDVELRTVIGDEEGGMLFGASFSATAELGAYRLLSKGAEAANNAFVAYRTPEYVWEWAIRLHAPGGVSVRDIAVHGEFVYVVGVFQGAFKYANGATAFSQIDGGKTDKDTGFILCLNKPDGSLVGSFCAKQPSDFRAVVAHTGEDGTSLVYVTGNYGWRMISSGTPEERDRTLEIIGEETRKCHGGGYCDIFVAALSTDLETCEWVNSCGSRVGGQSQNDTRGALAKKVWAHEEGVHDIVVGDAGDVYICGAMCGQWKPYADPKAPFTFEHATAGTAHEYYSNVMINGEWIGRTSWFAAKFIADSASTDVGKVSAFSWAFVQESRLTHSVALCMEHVGGDIYVGGKYHGWYLQYDHTGDGGDGWSLNDAYIERSHGGTQDGFIFKMNEDLKIEGRRAVNARGHGDEAVTHLLYIPDSEILLIAGIYGNPKLSLTSDCWKGDWGKTWTYLKANARPNVFLGALNIPEDDVMSVEWLQTTSTSKFVAPELVEIRGLAFQPYEAATTPDPADGAESPDATADITGRIFYAGNFTGDSKRTMYFGDSRNQTELKHGGDASTCSAFLSGVTEKGKGLEVVLLRIRCDLDDHEQHIIPGVGKYSYLSGERVLMEFPFRIYPDPDYDPETGVLKGDMVVWDPEQEETGTGKYDTRYTAIGYSLGDAQHNEEYRRLSFNIQEYTSIKIDYQTEYKLDIRSKVVWPENDPSISPEACRALGGPDPPVGVHWYVKAAEVAPSVDGTASGASFNAAGLRYVLQGYGASGVVPGNSGYQRSAGRVQITGASANYITMTGPGVLEYKWEKQYSVSQSTTETETEGFPLTRVTQQPYSGITQPDGQGDGEFWFTHGSTVQIGSRAEGSQRTLKGWLYGSALFPSSKVPNDDYAHIGELADVDPAVLTVDLDGNDQTTDDQYYVVQAVMDSSARVIWDYGDTILYNNVALGATGLDQPALTKGKPTAQLISSPAGSGVGDMYVWDEVAQKYLPLRPGTMLLAWKKETTGGTLYQQVTSGFPGDPIEDYYGNPDRGGNFALLSGNVTFHYKHIVNTPAVDLDPSEEDLRTIITDTFYFERDEGAEMVDSGTGASAEDLSVDTTAVGRIDGEVDANGAFTAGHPGRAVLLFSKSLTPEIPAVGDLTTESLLTRIVKSRRYSADTDWAGNQVALLQRKVTEPDAATIGAKITSATHDTAQIGTGCLLFAGDAYAGEEYAANYNASIYSRTATAPDFGPIIPVNRTYYADPAVTALDSERDLLVVWYEKTDDILWPYHPVLYRQFKWPVDGPRIVIASRFGSDGLDAAGNEQLSYDVTKYADVKIYNQPDRAKPGYNPNEEHALIAPSFAYLSSPAPPPAAYALRNDLNVDTFGATYTSDPRVLVQYTDITDPDAPETKMSVYTIEVIDELVSDPRAKQALEPKEETNKASNYMFTYWTKAGEPVYAPYPLNLVIDVNVYNNSDEEEGRTGGTWASPKGTIYQDRELTDDTKEQRTWWLDHRGQGWVVSANDSTQLADWDTTNAVEAKYFYRLRPEFWYDGKSTGDPVEWMGKYPQGTRTTVTTYPTVWPDEVSILKAGETLTYSGGEYRMDNPAAPGLPGVIGWAAGETVFDSRNKKMKILTGAAVNRDWTVRIVSPLEERRVPLQKDGGGSSTDAEDIPPELRPAGGNVRIVRGEYLFTQLSASLQRRVFYDPLLKELGIRGYVNDRTLGDSDLTAAPPAVYALEPNILTAAERDDLLELSDEPGWKTTVENLYALTRNPEEMNVSAGSDPYFVGVAPATRDDDGQDLASPDKTKAMPASGLGPGLAVIPNQAFLDPQADGGTLPDDYEAYVTLAENNHESLGAAPITLHIIKVRRNLRYRGAVKVILADNVFEEKAVLRHTGDFGTHTGDLVYQWFIREEDGTEQPVPAASSPDPWVLFGKSGLGKFQVSLEGTGPVILRDNLVFVRYRHVNEIGYEASQDPNAGTGAYASKSVNDVKWDDPADRTKWDSFYSDNTFSTNDGINYTATGEWAGAGNSPDVDGKFRPQLIMGWVKRVLDGINPYEARITDFTNNTSPATYTSMIQQAGPRYEGAVALNPDKDVIENHGLIELYTTVLNRAKALSIDLSQPANTPGVLNALLLAATRVSDFYALLGDEAFSDAMDPTIGIGDGNDVAHEGALELPLMAFENMMPSLIDEELALLRGVDDTFARPVYNRLFWNFVKGQGEVAYALNYQIDDVNGDGFINEYDAMKRYPQGHGDAWGHYLTAVKAHYDLLRHPFFNWQPRSELYNLMDIVLEVDFLDERRFAQAAAAKARAGAQIANLTYRAEYTEDADGQWQGYRDPNTDRAWGVEDWAVRAGQGALFDWMTANAILPVEAPEHKEGIERVDRSTVGDIGEISAQLLAVESTCDQANQGLNPLGVHPETVPFDIDPERVPRDSNDPATHFEQVYERAVQAVVNAALVFNSANEDRERLRQVAASTELYVGEAVDQDLAYRDALIEIFGAPYTGMIGAGKPYPAGYEGPDLLLYMYVDNRQIETDNLEIGWKNVTDVKLKDMLPSWVRDLKESGKELLYITDDPNTLRTLDGEDQSADFLNVIDGLSHLITKSSVPTTNTLYVPYTAQSYAYQVPEDGSWGSRLESGELQDIIAEMVLLEAQLEADIKAYQMAVTGLNTMWELLNARIRFAELSHAAQERFNVYMMVTGAIMNVINNYIAVADLLYQASEKTTETVGEALPEMQIGGVAVSIPIRPVVAGPLAGIDLAMFLAVEGSKMGMEQVQAWLDYGTMAAELAMELDGIKWDTAEGLVEQLAEFQGSLGDEKLEAIEILKTAEELALLAGAYTTTLKEGQRLLQERANWHTSLAARVQTKRYTDMALRVSRNDGLRQFREAFDLAARYTYLAAKAYDYETNLPETDPASAQGMLSDIVQERCVGGVEGGEIAAGSGLTDYLVKMKENYDALKGQMGFNNPQTETGRFSLRYELFRIKDDAAGNVLWRHALEQHRVDDLWQVQAFRQYCRPFASYKLGEQPGFVIPFDTQIVEGTNFFGKLLAAGDHTYDPSSFATKIRSVGVWFENFSSDVL
ncbi:MAG: hypothetical protein HON70_28675, partial [Lentisphaerae bacterium]|nr:hypothetical protein [Lentisphaerota bacterium]